MIYGESASASCRIPITAENSVVYLAIGSNLAPRKKHIINCLKLLKKKFTTGFLSSNVYLTRPYQEMLQPAYFNCCVRFKTSFSAREVLEKTSYIEQQLGRKRDGNKWESRTIDLDILFYGNELIDLPDLIIPHYDLSKRDFFIIPLLELDEELINPKTNQSLKNELAQIPHELRTYPIKLRKISC